MGAVLAHPAALLLAAHPRLVTPVLQVVHRVITRFRLGQAGPKADEPTAAAMMLQAIESHR
jgi:hypothetical protein